MEIESSSSSSSPLSSSSTSKAASVYDPIVPIVTHLLTHPTNTPSLHDQLLLHSHLPGDLLPPLLRSSDYPPLSPSHSLRWALSLFVRRCLRPPSTSSWRSKCPFQQPPPRVLSLAVEPAPPQWTLEERRAHLRRRLHRPRLGVRVPTLVGIAVPNALLFTLLLWDPLSLRTTKGGAGGVQ